MRVVEVTLQDLHTGMLVQQRDGVYMLVFLDTPFGDILKEVDGNEWMELHCIEEDLRSGDEYSSDLDIIRVLEPNTVLDMFSPFRSNYRLLWEEEDKEPQDDAKEESEDVLSLLTELEEEVDRMVKLLDISKKKYKD